MATRLWFTADTHFGHAKVVEFCGRPFESVEEMDAELIRRWNAVVGRDDIVIHLGDFALDRAERMKQIVSQLAGGKILVMGNHDSRKAARRAGFDQVIEGAMTIRADGHTIFLRHVPWPREVHERDNPGVGVPKATNLHLCGHVHHRWKQKGQVINVGVDQWAYTPVSSEELWGAKCPP